MASTGNCLLFFVKMRPEILIDQDDLTKFYINMACIDANGYVQIRIGKKYVYLHREILNNPASEVDHINGNKLDNRKINLREATRSQNEANKQAYRNNTSGAKGVIKDKRTGKYIARIRHNNKSHHIGCYTTLELAVAAYNKKAKELFGEFFNPSCVYLEEKKDV